MRCNNEELHCAGLLSNCLCFSLVIQRQRQSREEQLNININDDSKDYPSKNRKDVSEKAIQKNRKAGIEERKGRGDKHIEHLYHRD